MVAKSQILDFGGMTLQVKNIVVGYDRPNSIRKAAVNAVTQITSRTTGVTINAASGTITLVSAAGNAGVASALSFTVTNNQVGINDTVTVSQKSGTDLYNTSVTAVANGSFRITFYTTAGTTTEQPVFNFNVYKGVA